MHIWIRLHINHFILATWSFSMKKMKLTSVYIYGLFYCSDGELANWWEFWFWSDIISSITVSYTFFSYVFFLMSMVTHSLSVYPLLIIWSTFWVVAKHVNILKSSWTALVSVWTFWNKISQNGFIWFFSYFMHDNRWDIITKCWWSPIFSISIINGAGMPKYEILFIFQKIVSIRFCFEPNKMKVLSVCYFPVHSWMYNRHSFAI